MKSESTAPSYQRPTDNLPATHKEKLDKMMKHMTKSEMQHAANHMNNCADSVGQHADNTVTFNDFQKAKKVADTDGDNQ